MKILLRLRLRALSPTYPLIITPFYNEMCKTKKINQYLLSKNELILSYKKKMFLLCYNFFYSKIVTCVHIAKCFGFRAHND
jgi:hypothetical protein